jgi:TonB family protein
MTSLIRVAAVVGVIVLSVARLSADDSLAEAKRLYVSAAYDEALSTLGRLDSSSDVTEVDTYKALCLLALDRASEAEQVLENLAIRRPLFTFEGADVSPKLVTLYGEVRRRALPAAARALYESGRANLERGAFDEAARIFQDVVSLAGDVNASTQPAQAAMLTDLKLLAEGFAKLSEEQGAKERAARAEREAKAQQQAAAGVVPVFSVEHTEVVPPETIEQTLPPWYPPASFANQRFQGLFEVTIDETGQPVSATILQKSYPTYDAALLAVFKQWRFKPATKDGQPVKYRKIISIVLNGPPGR